MEEKFLFSLKKVLATEGGFEKEQDNVEEFGVLKNIHNEAIKSFVE